MIDQADPVTSDEFVLRRIPGNPDYYKPELDTPIVRTAFEPNRNDTDGVSLYRALFVSPEEVWSSGNKPRGYYVAQLSVYAIEALGLTVVPAPRKDDLPGHAIIPELRLSEFKADKRTSKTIQRELAKLASQAVLLEPEI